MTPMNRNKGSRIAKLELVIFDCGGVLAGSEAPTNKIFLQQLAEDGLEIS